MIKIEVNGREIEAAKGSTILEALKKEGIKVPTLCHLDGMTPTGACRICVVEIDGMPGLVPSCSYPAADGMKIKTHSPRVLEARKTIVELLLSNHPDDCLYCPRDGKCDLQNLSAELGIRQRMFRGERKSSDLDLSSPSITRDPEKCILCGKCVRVCEEVQSVSAIDFVKRGSNSYIGTAFDKGLNLSSCINCGQCIAVCPTGALHETASVDKVVAALADPDKYVVIQHAPSISVSLAEEFGYPPGKDIDAQMVSALRRIGFKKVFDTSFSADLTIMEEGSELIERITKGGPLPMMTSCSPGWIKFVEQFYPELLPNVSTCKSPQQMLGALIKHFFAEREGIDKSKIVSVSIMPCTAKKFECARTEMASDFIPDVDYVLTTREAGELIKMFGIDLKALPADSADNPFGERTTAGKIFGASGGVMEAAIRTAYHLLTGKELENLDVKAVRGFDGIKEAKIQVGDLTIGAAVASGLGNARKLMEEVKAGRKDLHFIEIMTCPGGCIAGGGQPFDIDKKAAAERMKKLYDIDSSEPVRLSHKNKEIQKLYNEFLGKPLGEKSHKLLHTHYTKRDVIL
ncbi:MAG: 4Fe-4S binding protein [Myxococcales bacterium]|nr:4Fe-4S binding protein [Myxococcales bacterium]